MPGLFPQQLLRNDKSIKSRASRYAIYRTHVVHIDKNRRNVVRYKHPAFVRVAYKALPAYPTSPFYSAFIHCRTIAALARIYPYHLQNLHSPPWTLANAPTPLSLAAPPVPSQHPFLPSVQMNASLSVRAINGSCPLHELWCCPCSVGKETEGAHSPGSMMQLLAALCSSLALERSRRQWRRRE